jgi:hypothetical protein
MEFASLMLLRCLLQHYWKPTFWRQDVCRQPFTAHHKNMSPDVEGQAILSNPQNVTSYPRTCGIITHHLGKWFIIVHVHIFKCSLFDQSELNNSLDPFFCPHLSHSRCFGIGPVHAYMLLHLYKPFVTQCDNSYNLCFFLKFFSKQKPEKFTF